MADNGSSANLAEKPAATTEGGKPAEEKESKRNFTYPLVKVKFFFLLQYLQQKLTQSYNLTRKKKYLYSFIYFIQFCDMQEEVRGEAVDSVVTAIEKHPGNYEVIFIKFKKKRL